MLKFITISILFMIIGCIAADKVESLSNDKDHKKEHEHEYETDIETLKILSDYGLINNEGYKCGSNSLDEV